MSTVHIEALRSVLKNEPLLRPDEAFVIERSRPHGHIEPVLECTHRLGVARLLSAKRCRERDLVLAMIIERLAHPAPKLATTRLWHTTILAEELAVGEADGDELYRAMDWLVERQDRSEKKLAARHLCEGTQVRYDVTSSYYEGHSCALMQFGHSRDGKRGKPIGRCRGTFVRAGGVCRQYR